MENKNSLIPGPAAPEPEFSERTIDKSLRISMLASALGFPFLVAGNVPFTMLLDRFGASGAMQGFASMLPQLALMAQIPGAIVVEMLRRRKTWWGVWALVHRSLWFIPAMVTALFAFNDPRALKIILVAVAVSYVCANLMSAPWQSWMADLVPASKRAAFWSERQRLTTTVSLIAMGVWGVILDSFSGTGGGRLGFVLVFTFAAVCGVSDILLHWRVVEPAPKHDPAPRNLLERVTGPLLHPGFRKLAFGMGGWTLACTVVGNFGALFLRQKYGVGYAALSVITVAAAVSTIVSSTLFGYLISRIGARLVAGVCIVIGPLFNIIWLFVNGSILHFNLPYFGEVAVHQSVVLVVFCALLNGGFFAGVALSHFNLMASVVPERGRSVAMAVQWTIIGVMGAAGPLIAGRVMDWAGATAPDGFGLVLPGGANFDYIHILILLQAVFAWFIALPFFLGLKLPADKMKFLAAIDRIVLVNPYRFATGIYNARVLSQPASRKSHFKAVEAVGNNATDIALTDLVAKTLDPAIDIREAAVHSLGKIGNAEAIAELTQIATQPGSDLSVAALRALRTCAGPSSAPALVPLLSHLNIEVVREAARTLGVAKNPAALDPLSQLLLSTRQEPVAIAAAEALSHLDDASAIYTIFPRMRNTANHVYHNTYAVCAGDLLGERDGFYKILSMDEHSYASGMAAVVKRLRKSVDHYAVLRNTPQHEQFRGRIDTIDAQYEARELRACAKGAFELACGFSAMRYNIHYRDDIYTLLSALEKRDPLFAAGIWFLAVLDGAFQRKESSNAMMAVQTATEILLAVFILASWSKKFRGEEDKFEGLAPARHADTAMLNLD